MVLSVSLVLLLGVLVWFLVRFAALRGWHALICVLFGFFLASTPLAPYISGMAAALSPGSSPESSSDQHKADCPCPQRKETRTHR